MEEDHDISLPTQHAPLQKTYKQIEEMEHNCLAVNLFGICII